MASVYWDTWVGEHPSANYVVMNDNWYQWTVSNTTSTTATFDTNYTTHTTWGTWNGTNYTYKVPRQTLRYHVWDDWVKTAVAEYTPAIRRVLAQQIQHAAETIDPTPRPTFAELQVQRNLASERAKELLLENLTPQQRQMFERHGYFHVRSQHGKRYRIHCNSHHNNVYELNAAGKEIRELCAAPRGDQPLYDKILGQKLALELAEDAFVAKANKWDLVGGREFERELCNVG